jgi:hypothetical protein
MSIDVTPDRSTLYDVPVLLAGRESFCRSYVAAALAETGARIIGPFASETDALASLRNAIEVPRVAVLAVDFADDNSSNIAEHLSSAGIPFVYLQERAGKCEVTGAAGRQYFAQPFGAFQVVEAVAHLAST